MTFEQAFQKVKAKFDKIDASKLTSDFAIQVNMTDSDCGGAFYIQSVDGTLKVEPYDYRDNTADVTLKKMDLYKILDGKLDVVPAAEAGKIIVNGNVADFAAAAACIVREEKPKAAKKAAPKAKAPAKKAAPAAKKAEQKKAAPKAEAKPAVKAEPKAEVKAAPKAEVKPAVKAEAKVEAKAATKTEAKKTTKK